MTGPSPMAEMMSHFASEGRVCWIGLRPAREAPVKVVLEAEVRIGEGIVGDRFNGKPDSIRQVTLMQAEHLRVIAALLKRDAVDPALLRRNIVVEGINLLALKDLPFRIGSVWLEMTGPCQPCSKMEKALGFGGYNAMRGHGGITAKVLQAGFIQVGDVVSVSGAPGAGFSS